MAKEGKCQRAGHRRTWFTMFTTAAWQISDKWLKANFTISNIYSQANNIYTKFLYASPLAKEKKRQEEIDKLVNEFTI
jgi:hypothetical protein